MKKQITTFSLLFAVLACFVFESKAGTAIIKLQVEYQTNPIGIDVEQPRFSWQMQSDQRGESQQAYRLLVSESSENLEAGMFVYDSGKKETSESVGIEYHGGALKPTTRYFWKVIVWNQSGTKLESAADAFFETGLMGEGWSNAKWIGSSNVQLPKYKTHYVIEYDVCVDKKSQIAAFVFGARDKQNFVTVQLDVTKNKPTQLRLLHTTDGNEMIDATEDISAIIPENSKHKIHQIKLEVTTAQYALKYFIDITVDGKKLSCTSLTPEEKKRKNTAGFWGNKEGEFTVYPYPKGDLVYLCRLFSIGFKQPLNQSATFSNVRISEKSWNTVLYSAPLNYTEKGTGELSVWTPGEDVSAPMLRKSVMLSKPVKQARLYATARGIYEFSVNGKKVGADYFNPGWTDYRYRLMYNTFDITKLLQPGENGIGVMLGAGWWSEHNGFMTDWQDQYGTRQSVMGKIVVNYTDGSSETIVTNDGWKCYDRVPITFNGLQNGEEYDARKEVKGWNEAGFNDSNWKQAALFLATPVHVKLQAYVGNPVRSTVQLTAQSVAEPLPGVYVYDMGQNMVGVPCLILKGDAGQEITIRYGEMDYPEVIPTNPVAPYTIDMYKQKKGQVYTDNYRSALSTDRYIMKGDAKGETYEPRFTFHGYRFVEIHGLKEPLPLENVKGMVLESIGEQTSGYQTSNKLINRLFENILWGQRGNFLSIPTDCPQRDERMGWTGDAQIFARSATYNMNVNSFYTRWLNSVRDNQGADGSYANYVPVVGTPPQGAEPGMGAVGWMEAGIIVPWQVYQQYNDVRILEEHYQSMLQYMNFMERRAVKYIQPYGGFGDWLALDPTNSMLTNTAYFAYDAMLMEQIASKLGKESDKMRFKNLYEQIKASFNKHFVDNEGYTYAPSTSSIFGKPVESGWGSGPEGDPKRVDTQTSYVVPLQFGLFDEQNKPKAIQHLVDNVRKHGNTLTTGFIGTPYLNLVLSDNGFDDLAFTLFEQTAYPSWLYPVLQGATTIWERWNSYTIVNGFGPVDMNSFNHYSYGAIEEWMMAYSAGIQRNENKPGYKDFILQPKFGGSFTHITGFFDSVYGRIESGWNKQGNQIVYKAKVPANTTATLHLQVSDPKMIKAPEGASFIKYEKGEALYSLQSGDYQFVIKINKPVDKL